MRTGSAVAGIIGGLIGSFIVSNWQTLLVLALAAAAYQHFEYPHGQVTVRAFANDMNSFGDTTPLSVSASNDTDDRIITTIRVTCQRGGTLRFANLHVNPGTSFSTDATLPVGAVRDEPNLCHADYHTAPAPHGTVNIAVDADPNPAPVPEPTDLTVSVDNRTDNQIITKVQVTCPAGGETFDNLHIAPGDEQRLTGSYLPTSYDVGNGNDCRTDYHSEAA